MAEQLNELRSKVEDISRQQTHGETELLARIRTKTRSKVVTEFETEETFEIMPWDDKSPIVITTKQMKEAFAENPRLQAYASLRGDEFTDPAIAPEYVSELLVDLIRRGHHDPAARNIRLNPSRSDQVVVKADADWEIRELGAAVRSLLEAVAAAIKNTSLREEERKELEHAVQHALAVAGLLYQETPEQYVQRVRKPIEAHLANMALMAGRKK
ncbi:MAG: hypothetical protein WC700_04110 [Gemmatimonadaceae bacterium]|jgi:hypothetical protein